MSEDTQNTSAIAIIENNTAVQLFAPGFIDPILESIETEVRAEAIRYDISEEPGRKAIASLAYKVARTKTFLDKQRKNLVSAEKERLKKIDAEGSRIWDRLEALQEDVRRPLTEWEDAEKNRVQAHKDALFQIEDGGSSISQNWPIIPLESMKDKLADIETESRVWEEFSKRAEQVKALACKQISEAIAAREKRDVELSEQERILREKAEQERKDREAQIAREAREKAVRESLEREERAARQAETERLRVEAERKAAEERLRISEERRQEDQRRAAAEKEAAEKRAEEDRRRAVEAEKRRAEEEKQREQAEAKKREDNKKHVLSVHGSAHAALLNHTNLSGQDASDVVEAIAKHLIPNVTISY